MSTRSRTRETIGIISARECMRMTLPPRGTVELREKSDGTWIVSYPDPGFIPCSPVCDLQRALGRKHKHDYTQKLIESTYQPGTYEAARKWAEELAEGFEIKIIPYARRNGSAAQMTHLT